MLDLARPSVVALSHRFLGLDLRARLIEATRGSRAMPSVAMIAGPRGPAPREAECTGYDLEAGPHGINVNLVAPGMVEGERFRTRVVPTLAAKHGITEDEAVTRHAEEYALRRITLDEDVANACLFMASHVSRQITGVDLPVDGGWASL